MKRNPPVEAEREFNRGSFASNCGLRNRFQALFHTDFVRRLPARRQVCWVRHFSVQRRLDLCSSPACKSLSRAATSAGSKDLTIRSSRARLRRPSATAVLTFHIAPRPLTAVERLQAHWSLRATCIERLRSIVRRLTASCRSLSISSSVSSPWLARHPPNNSFKPSPLRGSAAMVSLYHPSRRKAVRLNSGVRRA